MKIRSITILLFILVTPLWGDNVHVSHITSDSLNVRLIGQYPTSYSYAVAVDEERNIVFVGTREEVILLDVSDPSAPSLLSELPSSGYEVDGLFYRDNLLYVTNYHLDPDFTIISVDDPQNPEILGDYSGTYFAQCVTVRDSFAYVGYDLTQLQGSIEILSIADPSNPVFINDYPGISTPWQIVIEDSLAYIADELYGLTILSISDPLNIHEVGYYDIVAGMSPALSLNDNIVYLAISRDILAISVADPSNPTELSSYTTGGYPNGIVINGSLAFLTDGPGGFRVLSISDPDSLVEVGFYQTNSSTLALAFSEPYAFVTTLEEGLMIFEYYDPTSISDEGESEPTYPKTFSLSQNYPNPFNPSTKIDFTIPEVSAIQVHILVYDLRGRMIKELFDENKNPGHYSVWWDGKDERGIEVSSGVYLYKLVAGEYSTTKKMAILR